MVKATEDGWIHLFAADVLGVNNLPKNKVIGFSESAIHFVKCPFNGCFRITGWEITWPNMQPYLLPNTGKHNLNSSLQPFNGWFTTQLSIVIVGMSSWHVHYHVVHGDAQHNGTHIIALCKFSRSETIYFSASATLLINLHRNFLCLIFNPVHNFAILKGD
jgi:hypothetical protein